MLYRNKQTGQEVEVQPTETVKRRWLERLGFKAAEGEQPKAQPQPAAPKRSAATTDSPPNLHAKAPVDLKPTQVGNAPEGETRAQADAKAKKAN